mmetsp:Transcript_34586/g.100295  ORF Transcript_34586/g.100295 Transcript_34586/m.100295 type:complete len:201 (+) Transcript_34586:1131-1733(+)
MSHCMATSTRATTTMASSIRFQPTSWPETKSGRGPTLQHFAQSSAKKIAAKTVSMINQPCQPGDTSQLTPTQTAFKTTKIPEIVFQPNMRRSAAHAEGRSGSGIGKSSSSSIDCSLRTWPKLLVKTTASVQVEVMRPISQDSSGSAPVLRDRPRTIVDGGRPAPLRMDSDNPSRNPNIEPTDPDTPMCAISCKADGRGFL